MSGHTRRQVLKSALVTLPALLLSGGLLGCRRVVRVEQQLVEVEKEVTKIVREVVRETVIVGGTPQVIRATPQVIEKRVEKLVTAEPAPPSPGTLVIDALDHGWTQFAMQMTPAFQEVFPNIEVRWRRLSDWSLHAQAIATAQAAGAPADLMDTFPGTLPALWRRRGAIRALEDLIEAQGFDAEGIFAPAMASFRVGAEQVGLPFVAHPGESLLLYRPSLFELAGSEPPSEEWDLDAMSQAAASFRALDSADGEPPFAQAIDLRLPQALPLLHLFDAHLVAPSGRECTAADEGALACLEWAHEQVHSLGQAPAPSQMVRSQMGMFEEGRLATLRVSLFRADLMLRESQESDLGVSLYPRGPEEGQRAALMSGVGYCIGQRSEMAREALMWIKYLCTREMGVQMMLGRYAEPGCRIASWTDPRVLDRFPLCAPLAELCQIAPLERLPWNLRTGELLDAWNRAWRRLYSREASVASASAMACAAIREVLAKPPRSASYP